MGVAKGEINRAYVHSGYVDEFWSYEAPLASPMPI